MEFKGTPGQWTVDIYPTNNDTREIYCIQNENFDSLPTDLHIVNSYYLENAEVNRANALLISKAPEMLEMIDALCEELEFHQVSIKKAENGRKLIKEATEL